MTNHRAVFESMSLSVFRAHGTGSDNCSAGVALVKYQTFETFENPVR